MRALLETRPLNLRAQPAADSPRRPARLLLSVVALYHLPPLWVLAGVLPFAWRFQVLAAMTALGAAYNYRRRASLGERGLSADRSTVWRWAQRDAPGSTGGWGRARR